MRLLIVIINYRTARLTCDCLRSLAGEVAAMEREGGSIRVVVTDNASGDGSIDQIAAVIAREGLSAWASTMPLERNGGFAYGNNAAIRPALAGADPPDSVMLLNPDTLVRTGAVHSLLSYLAAHPRVGIVGSRLEDPDATPQRAAFRFPSVQGELDNGLRLGLVSRLLRRHVVAPPPATAAHQCDWVCGASMVVRREVFEDVGLLDERYFMYYEETDFCRRARDAGWLSAHVPASRVIHLCGQASGVTDPNRQRMRRPEYWFESRRRYFEKNHGPLYAALADAAWVAGYVCWRLRRLVQRKPVVDPPRLLRDFLRHSALSGKLTR